MDVIARSSHWVEGARPKTIPAAIVPVLVGTSSVATGNLGLGYGLSWVRFLLALLVSVSLQVGVNFANDYSDGIRGTDKDRVGPRRLVGSGLIEPMKVKIAAMLCFSFAAVAGLILAILTSWWLILVGVSAILSAWFYTGGPRPYGYLGFGEVFVFVYFGVVATVGSSYIQVEEFRSLPVLLSVPVGLLATALLVTNNLRDLEKDKATGKNTLAVRIGDRRTRTLYLVLVYSAPLAVAGMGLLNVDVILTLCATFLILAVVHPVARRVSHGAQGQQLIQVLEHTGRNHLAFGVLVSASLWANAIWC